VGGGVLTDHLQLVFGGVLLVLGEHAHVLRCPEGRCGFGDALAVFSIRMPPNLAESKIPYAVRHLASPRKTPFA
jgi:hypothetical protein